MKTEENEPENSTVWTVTHTGWLLLCPLYFANLNDEAPTPIPRGVPYWWLEFNLWLNNGVQWVVSIYDPECVGYLFYGVRELAEPKAMRVTIEG